MATTSVAEKLRELEEKLRHEILGTEERGELEDRVRKMRKRVETEKAGRA